MSYEIIGLGEQLSEIENQRKLCEKAQVVASKMERVFETGVHSQTQKQLTTENLQNTFGIRVSPLVGDYELHNNKQIDWTEPSIDCHVTVERYEGYRHCTLRIRGCSLNGRPLENKYVISLDDNDQLLPFSGLYIAYADIDDSATTTWTTHQTTLMMEDLFEAECILAELYPFAH